VLAGTRDDGGDDGNDGMMGGEGLRVQVHVIRFVPGLCFAGVAG